VVTCHSSRRRPSKIFQHHPELRRPALPQFVRECQTLGHKLNGCCWRWAIPAIAAVLARGGGQGAPERFVILRQPLGKEESGLESMLKGRPHALRPMGCCCPLPRNLLVEKGYYRAPRSRQPDRNDGAPPRSVGHGRSLLDLVTGTGRGPGETKGAGRKTQPPELIPLDELIVWPCLNYRPVLCSATTVSQPSGAISLLTYEILPRSSSDRWNLFHRCCCLCGRLEPLTFDRIAAFPMAPAHATGCHCKLQQAP